MPAKPKTERDAEVELRRLLGDAQGTALNPKAERNIQRRAEEIYHEFDSPVIAKLYGRILQTLQQAKIIRAPRPSDRCRHLKEELDYTGAPVTARRIEKALRHAGFSSEIDLGIQEAKDFRNTIWPYLRMLREKLEDVEWAARERMEATAARLRSLSARLPLSPPQPRDEIEKLVVDLEGRAGLRWAEEEVDQFVQQLRQLVRRQDDWPSLDHIEQGLKKNSWAQAHPDDSRVLETRVLIRQLHQIHDAVDQLAELPARVATHLAKDEIPAALDQIRRQQREYEQRELVHPKPLEQAAQLVVERLSEMYEQEVAAARQKEQAATDQEQRIGALEQLRGWLEQLPASLRDLGTKLAERCLELANEEAKRFQTTLLAEAKKTFKGLSVSGFGRYVDRLERDRQAALQEWGRQMRDLQNDLEAIHHVETDLESGCLRRLEQAASHYGPTPITESAGRLAREYRNALVELNSIVASAELGNISTARLTKGLKPIIQSFPEWQRVHDVVMRVQEADLLREIRHMAESGVPEQVQLASRQAERISDNDLRKEYANALQFLEEAVGTRDIMSQSLAPLRSETITEVLSVTLSNAITRADRVVDLLERTATELSRKLSPGVWVELEQKTKSYMFEEFPAAVRRWLDLTVPEAATQKELEHARSLLKEWLDVLDDKSLAADAERAIGRRSVEIRIARLESEGRFGEALAELKTRRALLGPGAREDTARLQRKLAIQKVHRGEDLDLGGLMATVRNYGIDPETLDRFLDHFRSSGSVRHLAELATSHPEALEHQEARELARWCRMFWKERLAALAGELAIQSNGTALLSFVATLPKTDREPQAFFVLHNARARETGWPDAVRGAVEDALMTLREGIERELRSIVEPLETLVEHAEAAVPPVPDSMDDARLKQELNAAFEETHAFIDQAMSRVKTWNGFLNIAKQWLLPTKEFLDLVTLVEKIAGLSDKLQRNRDVVAEMARNKEDILITGKGDPRVFLNLETRLVGNVVGSVPRLTHLLSLYFQDWRETVRIVECFVAAHRAGGTGLSPEDLTEMNYRLTREIGYDFHPGQDRFNLLSRLKNANLPQFMEELEMMVSETYEVDTFGRDFRRAMGQAAERLGARIERLEKESSEGARQAEKMAIDKILDETAPSGISLRELYSTAPVIAYSKPARNRLSDITESGWFKLLGKVIP